MTAHGPVLVITKTESVILTKKRVPTILPMRVREEVVETKSAAKYLGIVINCKLNVGE